MTDSLNSTMALPPVTPACDPKYSYFWENVKYMLQAGYMIPPALLYSRILYVIWRKNRKIYSQHQFFVIYSMDSVVGLLLLLLDIFITRFFVYVPQLCTTASQFFQSHPSFMNIYYPLLSYLHCAQPLIQIFLSLNRMSSVVWPVDHNKVWKKNLPFIFFFILLTPFLFIWNTIISQKVVVFYFGGFFMIGLKAVEWADISLFLFSVRSVAVMITVTSTVIMFLRMSKMKKRLKSSERILCLACVIHSICFMIPSFFEALALFNEEYGKSWINFLIQPFAWDVLNVGSPLIMIFVSGQLRNHVFDVSIGCLKKKKDPRRVTVQTLTVSFSSNH
ncbi:CRE-SRG-9 protein [Caenorhabditis remanei]|uniref:Serpentine receptor class gamma n=1 Tax=Caenorhabditis remanei TaxID=31234 RepID=E3LWS6_CAERE|nr:CRE-SRG-9 protein [Caenorhabditis remanei]